MNATGLQLAILSVSRQTYLEASGVLYSGNRFRFVAQQDKPFHVTVDLAVIPFLEDRSEATRRLIRVIDFNCIFDKFSLKFRRDIADLDCGFKRTCEYISKNLQLEQVTLCYSNVWNQSSRSDTA